MRLDIDLGQLVTALTLIFYTGANWRMLREHERRITKLEEVADATQADVFFMKGKKGVSL